MIQEVSLVIVFFGVVILVLVAPRIPLPAALRKYSVCRHLFHEPETDKFGLCVDLCVAPVLGVVLLLLMSSIGESDLMFGVFGNETISPISIVTLFMCLSYVCLSLDYTGLLEFIAFRAAKSAGSDGRKLFLYTFFLSSTFTILTSNDIVVLTLTTVICHFTRLLKLDPTPFLISQFFAANIWSCCLQIGNPTNIIVSLGFNISFVEYASWMIFPSVCSGLTALLVLFWTFRHRIPTDIQCDLQSVDPDARLRDRRGAVFGSCILAACLVMIACAFWTHLDLSIVTLSSAAIMLLRDMGRDVYLQHYQANTMHEKSDGIQLLHVDKDGVEIPSAENSVVRNDNEHQIRYLPNTRVILSRVPWKIIPFVFSMFVITNGFYRSSWFATAATVVVSLSGHGVWAAVSLMVLSLFCFFTHSQV